MRAADPPAAASLPPSMGPADLAGGPVVMLGVPFTPVTLAGAVQRIGRMIEARRPRYVVTPNLDFLIKARRDAALHDALVQADLVLCDGTPLVWAARWLGHPLPGRAAGSDLVPLLLAAAADQGWRLFLLGGRPEVSAEAARRIAADHPRIPAIAHYSPPHGPHPERDQAEIAKRIRAARPDLLLVCFGCPKQEIWMARNHRTLKVPVMIGAGGTIDFLAGAQRRAPRWMRRTGSEWLYRLAREPGRLTRRYLDDLIHCGPAIWAARQELRRGRRAAGEP